MVVVNSEQRPDAKGAAQCVQISKVAAVLCRMLGCCAGVCCGSRVLGAGMG